MGYDKLRPLLKARASLLFASNVTEVFKQYDLRAFIGNFLRFIVISRETEGGGERSRENERKLQCGRETGKEEKRWGKKETEERGEGGK